jgi:predicted nucleic acid-binding protein
VTRYLLDSDAIIDYLKGVPDSVALLQQLGNQGDQFYTSEVVVCEVFSVPLAPRYRRSLNGFVAALEYVTPSYAAAVQAGE